VSVVLGRYDSSASTSTIAHWDAVCGAPSGTTRHYLSIQDNWDGSFTKFSYSNDRVPIIAVHSWTDNPRHGIAWQDVADGAWDTTILSHAQALKALPGRNVPAYLVFHHEPENEEDGHVSGDLPAGETCGTRDQFKAAFEHFRALVRTVLDPTDALIGCTLMAGSFRSGRWADWVPSRYQFLGVDGYSRGDPKSTFAYCCAAAHDAAVATTKKLLIEEVGCSEIIGTNFKADFITEIRDTCKTWPELLAISYSNTVAKEDYTLDTSGASLAAWQAMAGDASYIGPWT